MIRSRPKSSYTLVAHSVVRCEIARVYRSVFSTPRVGGFDWGLRPRLTSERSAQRDSVVLFAT